MGVSDNIIITSTRKILFLNFFVCFGPNDNRLNFGDVLDYDPDVGSALRSNHMNW